MPVSKGRKMTHNGNRKARKGGSPGRKRASHGGSTETVIMGYRVEAEHNNFVKDKRKGARLARFLSVFGRRKAA